MYAIFIIYYIENLKSLIMMIQLYRLFKKKILFLKNLIIKYKRRGYLLIN